MANNKKMNRLLRSSLSSLGGNSNNGGGSHHHRYRSRASTGGNNNNNSGSSTPNTSWRKSELTGMIKQKLSFKNTTNNNDDAASPNNITMAPHCVEEFEFAYKTVNKLVKDSDFFPREAAAHDEWFASAFADDDLGKDQGAGEASQDNHFDNCSSRSKSGETNSRGSRSRVKMVHERDLIVGPLLGSGGFCEVRLAQIANSSPNNNNNHNNNKTKSSYSKLGSSLTAQTTVTTCSSSIRESVESSSTPLLLPEDDFIQEIAKEFLVSGTNSKPDQDSSSSSIIGRNENDRRSSSSRHLSFTTPSSSSSSSNNKTYAMKYLSPTKFTNTTTNKKTSSDGIYNFGYNAASPNTTPIIRNHAFERALADLVTEARFLSQLIHPNIVTLYYVGKGSLEENFNCSVGNVGGGVGNNGNDKYLHQFGYFLLMDPLHETLSQRIVKTYIPEILPSKQYGLLVSSSSSCSCSSSGPSSSPSSSYKWRIKSRKSSSSGKNMWDNSTSSTNEREGGETTSTTRSSSPNTSTTYNNDNNNNTTTNKINHKHHLAKRLTVIKSIASALSYMHSKGIICRDVKSDNIGFQRNYHPHCHCGRRRQQQQQQQGSSTMKEEEDCTCYEDVPKIFDFGLCRELKKKYQVRSYDLIDVEDEEVEGAGGSAAAGGGSRASRREYESHRHHRHATDTFKLTGVTGSRRWMAPEVAFSHPYNQKADVYSFGLVLYQVASLIVPFEGFSISQHEKEVLRGGLRPETNLASFSRHGSFSSSGGSGRGGGSKSIFYKKNKKSVKKMIITKKGKDDNKTSSAGNNGSDTKNKKRKPDADKSRQVALKTLRVWPKDLKCLMEESWDGDMRCRPEMSQVIERLDGCVDELMRENMSRLGSALRRVSLRRSSCGDGGGNIRRRSSFFSSGADAGGESGGRRSSFFSGGEAGGSNCRRSSLFSLGSNGHEEVDENHRSLPSITQKTGSSANASGNVHNTSSSSCGLTRTSQDRPNAQPLITASSSSMSSSSIQKLTPYIHSEEVSHQGLDSKQNPQPHNNSPSVDKSKKSLQKGFLSSLNRLEGRLHREESIVSEKSWKTAITGGEDSDCYGVAGVSSCSRENARCDPPGRQFSQ